MRVNTPEYKLWKQKQNEKNLIKRTKAKKKCKKQSNIKKVQKKFQIEHLKYHKILALLITLK